MFCEFKGVDFQFNTFSFLGREQCVCAFHCNTFVHTYTALYTFILFEIIVIFRPILLKFQHSIFMIQIFRNKYSSLNNVDKHSIESRHVQ